MSKNWLVAGALALTASMTATASYAQSTTVPGEQVGLATGAPLPEGIYALNTFVYQMRDNPSALDVGVNIPVLVWSTPLVPLGGRIELLVAPPTVFAFGKSGSNLRDLSINVGTFVGGIWAFDLGNNFGVSLLGGVYLNELNGDRGVLVTNNGTIAASAVLPQLSSNTYRFGVAGSYTGDGWNLTANLTANIYDSPSNFGGVRNIGLGGFTQSYSLSDSLNLDLTATKKFGKFEIGAIAYGTYNFDISAKAGNLINAAQGDRGRFLMGGLVGYDFGFATGQVYVARTVARSAASFDSTEISGRLIVPLYSPTPVAAVAAPIIRKY
ncbi:MULTISPECIES: transporter [unclassified Methylobacterium]|uniref:transporter n=1 Tax=unclassified Methylobacterium TaxID=2615210 RepID=UPI0006FE9DA8|nr:MULTISPECIES: transporter [unclassified Methylobacterium]KQP91372.1 CoxB-like protein [Methylobacterium sp. Leaf113]MCK2052708.1 transporter [Methylobacterium sp. 37f]